MLAVASAQNVPPAPAQMCGGTASLRCPAEFHCDTSACKTTTHCDGVCVKNKQQCGGIAGMQCDIGYDCVKKCGPKVSDCMGVCEKAALPTCATMICTADSRCEEDPISGAKCVPLNSLPTCSVLRCAGGCEENPKTGAKCVPQKPSCATTFCIATTNCKDHPTKGPVCVPIDPPTCASTTCEAGMDCVENKDFGAECAYNCRTREVWTSEKSKWCCENKKVNCPAPAPAPVKPTIKCMDGEVMEVDCNTCSCSNGQFSVCTLTVCECKKGDTKQKDCNSCVCEKGMFSCTEMSCEKEKECGGFAGVPCPNGFECETKCDNGMTDCMGTCKKIKKGCKSNDDCEENEFCRAARNPTKKYGCSKEMVCVPRAKESESCGGYTVPCYYSICEGDLKCVTPPMIADASGTCRKPFLSEGEVCRIDGPSMWAEMDRSSDCPKGTMCRKDTNEWRCMKTVRCTPSSCGDEEVCIIDEGKIACVEPKPVPGDCGLSDDAILCAPGGMCKEGYACTGCQQMCKCSNGEKVCTEECRPACKKIEDKPQCMAEAVSQWKNLGCETFSCYGFVKSPSVKQQKYCCEMTGRYCKDDQDQFDCKDDPRGWGYAQRKWCCEEKKVACPVAPYDCSVPEDSLEIMKNAEGLLQTSVVDYMWDEKKSAYCCKNFQVGCPTDVDIFDCEWNSETVSAWTEDQSEWCCSAKGMRCRMVVDETDDFKEKREMCQAKKEVRSKWSEETRKMCCLIEEVECAADKYDCYGDSRALSEWEPAQRKWCCDEQYVGCDFDCRAGSELLTDEDKEYCCNSKGLHCTVEVIDEPVREQKKHSKALRLSFKGSFGKIKENPKKFLRKLRTTILMIVKGMKPEGLRINFLGGLMKDDVVPPMEMRERWGTKIPPSWNMELYKEETEEPLIDEPVSRSVSTLGAGSVSELKSLNEGAFVEFEITDNDQSVVDLGEKKLNVAVDQSKSGTGPLRDNSDGNTLIMEPIGEGMAAGELTSTPKDSSSNNNGLLIALSLISALCVGGMVIAGVVLHKRRQQTVQTDGELLTFEKCESLQHDECRV